MAKDRYYRVPDENVRALLEAVKRFLLAIGKQDCEPLEGDLKLRVKPMKRRGMTVTYEARTLYCCDCESDTPGCGKCKMSDGSKGAIFEEPWHRGVVEGWTFGPGSASRSKRKKDKKGKKKAKKG